LFRIELSFNYKFGGNNSKLEKKFQTLKTTNFERIGKFSLVTAKNLEKFDKRLEKFTKLLKTQISAFLCLY
jgi:hypothetical protein